MADRLAPLNTWQFPLYVVGFIVIIVNPVLFIDYLKRQIARRKWGAISEVEVLLDLSPVEFEAMVADLYRKLGHKAYRRGRAGDHSVDIVVKAKNGKKWIVQRKRWRGNVGEPVIRDFYRTMQHEEAAQGAIVTTGRFSRPARAWAKRKPIHLYEGAAFLQAWRKVSRRREGGHG